jgi:tetratricopeptide (TPR) repeat protein
VARLQDALAIGRRNHLEKALRLWSHQAGGSRNRPIALATPGDLVETVVRFRQTPPLRPDLTDASLDLDDPLHDQDRFDEIATSHHEPHRFESDGPGVQNDLGIELAKQGRLDEAAVRFRRAIALKPDYPDAHNNLGNTLEKQDKLDEAVASYQRAIDLKPAYPEAHYNLGIVLARQGRRDEAAASYQQAIALKPDYVDAHNNLGTVLARQDQLDEAAASYEQALRLNPNSPGTHHNLGRLLARQNKLDEAAASYRRALRLKPDDPEVHNHLGIVLAMQGRLDEAAACFQRAIGLEPDFPDAHNNLGSVLEKQDRFGEAVACFQRAVDLKLDFPDAHNNLGIALGKQGRLDEAVASYQQAVHFKPDYAEAHWNRGLAWLQMGQFEQGWPGYEWRWKCKDFGTLPPFQAPLWDGSPLAGRTLLVHAEQGLGDTLQFIRYAPLVQERGGRVIMMCQPLLTRLLARSSGIERLLAHGDPTPEFDFHVPLLSLPGLLGTTLESVPAGVPYLDVEPELVETWRQRLSIYPGFKIGIAWQGNPEYRLDRVRSIPLAQFGPVARVPGVHLLSLQKNAGREQLAAPERRFPVTDLGGQLDDFVDTAAVMKNLDLVITSDTSIAHLAGALGVPVWVALHEFSDWRWLQNRDDCPWYPTMRLCRQARLGQWEDVFHRIAEALRERLAAAG